ncbi:MAG: AAA family ATPase [Myxococcales bacterium]|nr:AAA family ATPase [Myxococcales bacterium]
MTITRLHLKNFTVFEDTKFEFCPGINVLIGENATGKTHVLKTLYASRTALDHESVPGIKEPLLFSFHVLRSFFGLRAINADQLRRHGGPFNDTRAIVDFADAPASRLALTGPSSTVTLPVDPSLGISRSNARHNVFIPPRDVLAMYPGFTAAFENRELSFDATHYDLCRQLSAARLRGKAARTFAHLLAPIEAILGGEVLLEHDGFHVRGPHGDVAAPFLAEGWRKLATLAYLIANGSLHSKSILFIDEPESSLNPTLTVQLVEILRHLAHAGVQIFLASHDYLLVHRLSQAAEHALEPSVPLRFFALHRPDPAAPVQVETADTLAQIDHNAILAEFARYYDDEQRYTLRDLVADASTPTPAKKSAKKSAKTTSKRPAANKTSKKPSKRA